MGADRRSRPGLASLLGAFLVVAGGCTDDVDDPPTEPDQASACCECACASDGIPCLNITVERNEGASCPELCEAECAAHDECSTVGAIGTCNLLPPDDPGGPTGSGPCSEVLDDELDRCDQNQ